MDCIMVLNLTKSVIKGELKDELTINTIIRHLKHCKVCNEVVAGIYTQTMMLRSENLGKIQEFEANGDGHYSALTLIGKLYEPFLPITKENMLIHFHLGQCLSGCGDLFVRIAKIAMIYEQDFKKDPKGCLAEIVDEHDLSPDN